MPARLETRLADELDERTFAYAELVLDRIAAELPELLADERSRALARTGSQALLREFGTALRHELGAITYHAPAAALAFSRHLARAGVSLASILRSYRLGQEVLFARAAELASEEGASEGDAVTALARIGTVSFRFVDGAMTDVAHEYETQRELFIRGTLAQRASTLQALLSGRAVDIDAAERTLGRRFDGAHVAVVAWSADTSADGEAIAGAARELVRAIGHGRPLIVADAPGAATIWTTPGPVQRSDHAGLLPPGTYAAIGRPGTGVAGFVATKRQADLARLVAGARTGAAVTFYDDAALTAVLLRDRDAARAFAAEELGELAVDTRAARELRETLTALFANQYDQSRTADALCVHRNTVAKRLRRAEAILGRPITSRPRELGAALLIAETLAGG